MKYFVFSLLGIFALLIYILHTIYDIPVVYAQDCSDSASRADGLITSPQVGTNSKFGTSSGACVIDPKAAFTPYKIPTYEDLKSIYYTQAKAPIRKTQIADAPTQNEFTSAFTANDIVLVAGDLEDLNYNEGALKPSLIFVDGNLVIGNNITYGDANSGIVFIVKGNVNITQTVTRIDAIIISEGIICTAYDGIVCPETDARISQLVINGSLISLNENAPIEFRRILNNNTYAAEVINNQVKYLVILRNLMSDTLQRWSEVTGGEPSTSASTSTSIASPVTFVASAQSINLSWTQDCGSEENRMLIVTVANWRANPDMSIKNITYAGRTLDKLGQAYNTSTGAIVAMYYLINPAANNNSITADTDNDSLSFGSSCWSGVSQSAPSNFTSATGNSRIPSVTVPSANGNTVIDGVSVLCSQDLTASGEQTLRATASKCNSKVGHSSKAGAATSTIMSWINSGTVTRWAIVGATLTDFTPN